MATKKTPAKQTAAKKAATKQPIAKSNVAMPNPRREQLDDAVELAREIVTTSVGLPFAIQARLAGLTMFEVPRVDLAAVATLLDDAKAEGATKLAAIQGRIDPIAATVQQRAGELTCLVVDSTKKLRDRVAA
jgi:hypothetical protein